MLYYLSTIRTHCYVRTVTDTTEKPKLVDDDDYNAIYGSQRVVCMDGTTPGISEGSWEKEGVTVENAINVSAECPNCFECPVVNIETFLTLPSVRERLEQGYSHSAFFISTSHVKVQNRDYSDCLDIKNTYVTFLVIREVQPEDYGGWEVRVVSAYNVQQSAVYTIGACELNHTMSPIHKCVTVLSLSQTHTHTHTHTHQLTSRSIHK